MTERDPIDPPPSTTRDIERRRRTLLLATAAVAAVVVVGIAALLITIFDRKQEARHPYVRLVEVDDETVDPAVWGQNWPRQYESYRRTVDYERTRYGGSDAVPKQKLDQDPWLRTMWAGYAFSLDYRESRGHMYMLHDQDHTERVLQRPQPGACLHCHASVIPAYRYVGDGDVMEGFRRVSAMTWNEARHLTRANGDSLITHPAGCVDCHNPQNMALRITRPAFMIGIASLKRFEGVRDYDVNRDATRQEMRTYICAQCHVEYYFARETKLVTYPWARGVRIEQIISYYDSTGYSDWRHELTGAPLLKAQHPEFELWSQGVHARAGVSCSDCHMPYLREGAMKVSDHHVRSPLLNVARACQTCHNVAEGELLARAHTTQDRTQALVDRAAAALSDAITSISAARAAGSNDAQLRDAWRMQREAQFRIDYVYSEGSRGFHASQETARILAEAIDYARRGEAMAVAVHAPRLQAPAQPAEPVRGVTPTEAAPPGPYQQGGAPPRRP